MAQPTTVSGNCLCGSVTLRFAFNKDAFGACHCNTCRQWAGGPRLYIEAGSDVAFEGEDFISVYSSSEWAERGFCKQCGTHLFYRLKAGGFTNVPLGLIKNLEHLKFESQIFIDKKPEHYSFANKTELMTEAEVFAKYAPSES